MKGFVIGRSPVVAQLERLGFVRVRLDEADLDLLRFILKVVLAWMENQAQMPLAILVQDSNIYVVAGEANCSFMAALLSSTSEVNGRKKK